MVTARIPGLSKLWRAILPAGGVAALLLVMATAAPRLPVAEVVNQAPAHQVETRDPDRLAILPPQNPVQVVRRDDRAGERRTTPHDPLALTLRPAGLAKLFAPALRHPSEFDGPRACVPTKHVQARAPPAAA
jgi:hypothetical protein